jgi:polyphosphate kinase
MKNIMDYFKNYLPTIIIPITINKIPSISFFENVSLKYTLATKTPKMTDKPLIIAYVIPEFIFCKD